MLRHALRRLLWTPPTLVGVSLVTFALLSYVPDPTDDPASLAELGPSRWAELRRERFLDLPRFVNAGPRDVRARATEAVLAIAAGGADGEAAAAELARLGGAALPYTLPLFDALAPEPRARVALALAPIAARMGLTDAGDATSPERAATFWARFWDDRSVELREASVRTAVARLTRYRSESREADLIELDTFALDAIFSALETPSDAASVDRARTLIDVAAHVTGRDDRIAPGDDVDQARLVVRRWKAYWRVHRADFVPFEGISRAGATVLETRYGKWALGVATVGLGTGSDGEPIADEIARRAPVTLAILLGGIALAYGVAVPLGAAWGALRSRRAAAGLSAAALAAHALPTAVLAVLVARATRSPGASLLAPTAVLAAGLLASPASVQRAAVLSELSKDYARAALARGASRARVLVAHALRNALLPAVTLAALEAPMALGGAFVVERVFGLDGLGEATIRSVEARDTSWLMALSIAAAAAAAVFVLLSDLAYALLDPRLVRLLARRGGR